MNILRILQPLVFAAAMCFSIAVKAEWEITSSGSPFEVSDGDWILQCQKSGSEGGFKISKVIHLEKASLT